MFNNFTDSFASGCYTYTLLVDGASVATNKLVIIK